MGSGTNDGLFKGLLIILLLFITFFLGSMWLKCPVMGGGSSPCAMMQKKCQMCAKKDGVKMCPLTGKPLSEVKGSH